MGERPRRVLRVDGQDARQTAVAVQEHFILAVALAKGADFGVGRPEHFVWLVCHIRTVARIDGLSGAFRLGKTENRRLSRGSLGGSVASASFPVAGSRCESRRAD